MSTGGGVVALYAVLKAVELVNRVKRDVRAAGHELLDGLVGVGRTVSVCQATKFIIGQQHLVDRAGRRADAILTEDGERAPQGIGLESHDNLYPSLATHPRDEIQIAPQLLLVDYVIRGLQV